MPREELRLADLARARARRAGASPPASSVSLAIAWPSSVTEMPGVLLVGEKRAHEGRGEHPAEVARSPRLITRPPVARRARSARRRRRRRDPPSASEKTAAFTPQPVERQRGAGHAPCPKPRRGKSSPGSQSSRPGAALAPVAVVDRARCGRPRPASASPAVEHPRVTTCSSPCPRAPRGRRASASTACSPSNSAESARSASSSSQAGRGHGLRDRAEAVERRAPDRCRHPADARVSRRPGRATPDSGSKLEVEAVAEHRAVAIAARATTCEPSRQRLRAGPARTAA